MADSAPMDLHHRPQKIPNLDKPGEEPKKSTTYARLRVGNAESDEYMRQYLQFHYDFHRTQGFGIEWDKFDFCFNECEPCDGAPRINGKQTNEEVIEKVTLCAIAKYNEENGTNIVVVEQIEANYAFHGYLEFWITFWGQNMSLVSPESKIYQTNTTQRASTFSVDIFRVKPTDEEMLAAPIHVDPPYRYHIGGGKPPVVFSFAGPGDDPVPGTPFTFNRNPPQEDNEKYESEDSCKL